MIKKLILLFLVIGIAVSLATVNLALNELKEPLALDETETTYTVRPGASLKLVLRDFQAAGWISESRVHEAWFRFNDQTNIQRGEYILTQGMTSEDAIMAFIEGRKVLRSVQFIEGTTFSDYLEIIRNNEHLSQTLADLSKQDILAQIDPELEFYEGWFFPDTYLFEEGTTDLQLLRIAHQRMQSVLAEQWELRSEDTAVSTPYEALILASIIEKETGAAFERPMISGVFTNRLEIGMRLQTDPTVIYGVGEDFDGNLTRSHLRTDTPYNTYTRAGLPPTPIANPGREAIAAALNPVEIDALFFVAKGDGTHQFSKTLAEHNAAVRQYQRFGRVQNYQSAPSTEAAQ